MTSASDAFDVSPKTVYACSRVGPALADDGPAPPDRIYTATLATMHFHMFELDEYLPLFEEQLQALQPYVDEGKVRYVFFQDLPRIWEQDFDDEPNQYGFGSFAEEEFTCDAIGNPI